MSVVLKLRNPALIVTHLILMTLGGRNNDTHFIDEEPEPQAS